MGSERTKAQVQAGWRAPSRIVPRPILGGRVKPAADVPLAPAEDGRVHRESDRLVARGLRPLDQLLGQPAVAEDVELEPLRPVVDGGDLLDGAGPDGGERVGDADLGGGPGDGQLALGVGDAGEAGGGEHQRQRDALAEEGRRRVDVADVAQHAGLEGPGAVTLAVGHDGPLVLGGTVDVVEHAVGQAALGDAAQVAHVGRLRQSAGDGIELDRLEADDRAEGLDHAHVRRPPAPGPPRGTASRRWPTRGCRPGAWPQG